MLTVRRPKAADRMVGVGGGEVNREAAHKETATDRKRSTSHTVSQFEEWRQFLRCNYCDYAIYV